MFTMRHCAFAVASTLATVAATAAFAPAASANAFTGTYDGWTYIQDATHDSTGGRHKYEIFGLASKQVGNQLHFAINANMGLEGVNENRADDGNISFGDLFLHFDDATFGIRFAESNDSGVTGTGVFADVTTKDVTEENAGWARQTQYKKNQTDARFYGDERDDDFFSNSAHRAAATVINTGNYIGAITAPKIDLLDFSKAFGGAAPVGKNTVGFSFDLTPAMVGRFDAELLLECINDGLALTAETTKVPEPASLLGLVSVAALAGTQIRRKKAQQT